MQFSNIKYSNELIKSYDVLCLGDSLVKWSVDKLLEGSTIKCSKEELVRKAEQEIFSKKEKKLKDYNLYLNLNFKDFLSNEKTIIEKIDKIRNKFGGIKLCVGKSAEEINAFIKEDLTSIINIGEHLEADVFTTENYYNHKCEVSLLKTIEAYDELNNEINKIKNRRNIYEKISWYNVSC